MHRRDPFLDALRGIAIVLVVVGHALRGVERAGISTGPVFDFLDVRLYSVHVQLLFFVSGIVVVGSLVRRGAADFAGSRFSAILWPMIFWTYVFIGAKLFAGPHQNAPVSWDALLALPIPGQLHLWFLWALFLMHLLLAALWALAPERTRSTMLIALFVGALFGTTVSVPEHLVPWVSATLLFLPYFALGALIGLHGVESRRGAGASLLAAAIALGAFLAAPQIGALTGSGMMSALLACIGAYFSASLVLNRPRLLRGLTYLGVSSMAIYVLHTIFSAGAREALLAAGNTAPGMHIVLGVLAGILLPIAVREVFLRIGIARPLALA